MPSFYILYPRTRRFAVVAPKFRKRLHPKITRPRMPAIRFQVLFQALPIPAPASHIYKQSKHRMPPQGLSKVQVDQVAATVLAGNSQVSGRRCCRVQSIFSNRRVTLGLQPAGRTKVSAPGCPGQDTPGSSWPRPLRRREPRVRARSPRAAG